jgi:RTX calcium-binding nonapeptide repeat (4 copies)
MTRATRRRTYRLAPTALAALLACAVLGASSASASDDPCANTGSVLIGGQERNVFCGTSGNDTLRGNGGNDELRGEGGNDLLEGGADNDEVRGGAGDDTLTGGSGRDTLSGASGDDLLQARDGEAERALGCGSGADTINLDLVDAAVFLIDFGFTLSILAGCDAIRVGAVNEGPNVVISGRPRRVSEDGRTSVRLRCPASLQQPSRCRGRLRLQLRTRGSLRRRAPRTRYSIRPGRSRRVSVRLSRRDRRTLRRRRRARGVVTSVEAGQHGRKTTVQTINLRARR